MAIKDIGGFRSTCDAGNPTTIATLRVREHRPAKPLAAMPPSTADLPADAAALMGSPTVPIVLVTKAQASGLCDEIASRPVEVGVMLPFNPLQYLFLQVLVRSIVMASGNLSGRLPALSNA